MREPKRLAHRQAERNKARALKRWSWEDPDEELLSASPTAAASYAEARDELLTGERPVFQT